MTFADDLLDAQTILITGGGTGLGRAMAERFGALGARVAVLGRREAPLDETVAAIEAAGGRAAFVTCDVRDAEAVDAAVARLEDTLGPITGLVNNAAGNFLAATEDLSTNAFDTVVRIVLHGTFHVTQALGRRWIERHPDAHDAGARGVGAHVLSIVTTYVYTGSPFVVPSACAKAGVLAMTRSLAVEWATYGIRLNAIAPGPFPTDGAFSRLVPPGVAEKARQAHPLRRFGRPEELADLAAYLFAPAASYMNGECVVIDGGAWLKEGGEFSAYTDMPRADLKETMARMRPGR